MMKRILIFFLIVSTSALFYGFRGAGYRGDLSVYGEYTFNDIVTFAKSVWITGDTVFWTDGGADTSYIIQTGSYFSIHSDNTIRFGQSIQLNGNFAFDVDTIRSLAAATTRAKEVHAKRFISSIPDKTDSAVFSGSVIVGTAYIRGTATFTVECTSDTVEIVGTGANDFFFLQIKGATVTTSPITYTCKTNTLFVYCAEGDTSVLRASGFNWLRMQ